MSYDEMQKYRDQEPFAPPWSNHLKTFGQMVADCQSLLCSIDAKPTCADSIRMAEVIIARVDRSKMDLTRAWNASSADEQAWLKEVIAGKVE